MKKAEKIILKTDGIGWGFHEGMSDIYYDYYGDFDENILRSEK